MNQKPDVVIIGYNETPFDHVIQTLKAYGDDSEAYRDLKTNFIEVNGKNLTYVDLLAEATGKTLLSCDIPNLAAVYLSHYLIRRGLEVDFINLFQQEKEKLKRLIEQSPVCVAITTTFYVTNLPVSEMVQFIRSIDPRLPIVLGGVLVSNHYNAFNRDDFFAALQDMGGDIFVLEAQGEKTLYEIATRLKYGKSLADIKNVIFRDANGNLVMNPQETESNSLDEESIDWTVFKNHNLGNTLQTRTARSCAFGCAFCGYPERGGPLTLASMDTVAKELESMRSLGNVRNVVFIDDTFNVPKARFKEFCKMLIERRFEFNWFSYFRCDHGDEEALDLMKQSGCKGVFLGIESGSQEILEKMNKRAKVTSYEKGIKAMKERGILTFASLITGYPGETEQDFNEMLQWVEDTRFDRLGCFTYSHEEKTHAHQLEDDIPEEVKQERVDAIMEVQQGISFEKNQERIGQTYKVLIDKKEGQYFVGRTEFDSPEVDNEVLIDASQQYATVGSFVNVEIDTAEDFDLYGQIVK